MNDTPDTTKSPLAPGDPDGAMSTAPLLSIGIPLYRAAAFYDTIVENIDSIDYPHVEILISDRHLADDTIDRLDDRYRNDRRVTTYRHDDEGEWWDNYNFLLHTATGDYFRWLPQDDLLPRHGLERLVERMEADADVILVYHRIDNVNRAGEVLVEGGHDVRHASRPQRPWRFRDALSVAAQLHHHAAGTGIIRRDRVIEAGLRVPPIRGGLGTTAFRYGLACRGRFEMVTDVVGYYRWHSGNWSHYSKRRYRYYWDYFKAVRQHSADANRVTRFGHDLALLVATLLVAPMIRFVWNQTPKGRLARRTMRSP